MNKKGEIILIEDDLDDQELLSRRTGNWQYQSANRF